jgi:hypothetical protein
MAAAATETGGITAAEPLAVDAMLTLACCCYCYFVVAGCPARYGIQQALDLGADGVMVPLVNSRADAEQVRVAARNWHACGSYHEA